MRSPQVTNPKQWLTVFIGLREKTDKVIEQRWLFMPLVGTSIVVIAF